MPCIFCDSLTHFSQYCDIYVTDDSRKAHLQSKNCCESCLMNLNSLQHDNKSCNFRQKCYICFSDTHCTVFCPDRNLTQILFLPKIDGDLFSRFCQMFYLPEQYSLKFAYLDNTLLPLKPFKVFKDLEINHNYMKEYSDVIVVVTNELKLCKVYLNFDKVRELHSFALKNGIFYAQKVKISNVNLSKDEFFAFVSSKTTHLCCTECTLAITFTEITEKLPNLESLDLGLTKVKWTKSMPQDLMECHDICHNSQKLKYLKITIADNNICMKTLASFMKGKKITVKLCIEEVTAAPHFLTKDLTTYFVDESFSQENAILKVYIIYKILGTFKPL